MPFSMENGWFPGGTPLKTYTLEEIAGTKLSKLYQRKKGRDLFDPYRILQSFRCGHEKILVAFPSQVG
jgi:predicted nucleotidyltransferase component of viral defense system